MNDDGVEKDSLVNYRKSGNKADLKTSLPAHRLFFFNQGKIKMSLEEQAKLWFERLEQVLEGRKLPCENGPARVCSADEFMFMQESGGEGHFKHRDTRNYVIVKPLKGEVDILERNFNSLNGYELFVPFTTKYFQAGFFDAIQNNLH